MASSERDAAGGDAGPPSSASYYPLSSGDAKVGEGGRSASFGENRRAHSMMPLEGHATVLPSEGGVIIFKGPVPDDWDESPDAASLAKLGRNAVFQGELLHILVHITPLDPSISELVAPEAALEFDKPDETPLILTAGEHRRSQSISADGSLNFRRVGSGGEEGGGGLSSPTLGKSNSIKRRSVLDPGYYKRMSSVKKEGHERRSRLLYEAAERSHYYVRITDPTAQRGRQGGSRFNPPTISVGKGDAADEADADGHGRESSTRLGNYGCTPLTIEEPQFDPRSGGGLARRVVATCALPSGDVAVLLEVCVDTNVLTPDAVLEVLQYEQVETISQDSDDILTTPSTSPLPSPKPSAPNHSHRVVREPINQLQQWLLPIERTSNPPSANALNASFSNSWSSPASFLSVSSSSSSFGFSISRLPSSSFSLSPPVSPLPPLLSHPHSLTELDLVGAQRDVGAVGAEGLLSFRAANLEPQRFSGQCGLEGCYVPGRRWMRPLSVLQPLFIESYTAACNMQDLVCILVENILPEEKETSDLVLYIDSINMECHPHALGGGPLPVQVASVEAGEGEELPGLPLRPGEQHSFVLRPATSAIPGISSNVSLNITAPKQAKGGPSHRLESMGEAAGRRGSDSGGGVEETVEWEYSVVIACRCSHSESRLYYRHALTWQPRSPRDLLLSVTLDDSNPSISDSSNFAPQMVTIRATNLTSAELNLTLLAPSSLASTALSRLSFPTSPRGSQRQGETIEFSAENDVGGMDHSKGEGATRVEISTTREEFGGGKSRIGKEGDGERKQVGGVWEGSGASKRMARSTTSQGRPPSSFLSRIVSLPPVHRMESLLGIPSAAFESLRLQTSGVMERATSAAELLADQLPERSHLWLQSVVPIGRVPPNGTAEVQCELLALTDGIITLDTLHIATRQRDMLFIPEQSLQLYKSSSRSSSSRDKGANASAYSDFGVGVRVVQ